MANEFCMDCGIEMKKTYVSFNDVRVEAQRCGNCGKRLFPEHLAIKALKKLESQKLEPFYHRKPIKIGSSWAITLPKEIVKALKIEKKTMFKIRPKLHKNMMEVHKHINKEDLTD
ncbi:MAG: AbrB/MazE/SpoVT family DNA-binding domain-containing protein [Nanoarchaeota archaeon]